MSSSPYRIALINMPFGQLSMPSIALTQLSAVLKKELGAEIEVSTHYLNLDFAAYFGDLSLYNHTHSATALLTGIGEWFFRGSAFPDAVDNADTYYDRFYFSDDTATRAIRNRFEEKRLGLDAFLDQLIDQYSLHDVDLVGFTTLFTQTVASCAMARRIKIRNSDVVTVIGGAACDAVMGMEIANHVVSIDAVFSGPALESFPRFVGHLVRGDPAACEDIDGVFTRGNRDRWPGSRSGKTPIGLLGGDSDINDLIPLDYEPFLEELSQAFPEEEVSPVLLFETSRGCWWAEKAVCSFCGLNGLQMKHRALRPEKAITHLESLYPYVPRSRVFMGVDTVLPKGYTQDVFPKLSPPDEMVMFYELKADVTKEEIAILVKAGVRAFQPGIESLSTATLKRMRKGTSSFRNILFLKHCSIHPVRIDWNLLVFSPGEEEAVYEKTLQDIPRLVHLAPPTGAYPISFARFSRYFEDPESHGLDLKPQEFYGFIYPFDAPSITNLAYHFVDDNADVAHMDAWLNRLNAAIGKWTARWLAQDGEPQARLCFSTDDTSWAVYDSRSGQEIETDLSDTEKCMLDALDEPCAVAMLRKTFGIGAEDMLHRFQERGWLFEDRGRFISLVT